MGIPGLFGFLQRNGLTQKVDLYDVIETWKGRNSGKTPIIVIDFKNFTYCVARKIEDAVCGGRHQMILESWEEILKALKSTGSDLVFFSDLNTTTSKMDSWMKSQDEQFHRYANFYKSIDRKRSFKAVLNDIREIKAPNSAFYDMIVLAQKYGDFHYSVKNENDFDLAQYATNHDAVAIISNDTDFLIFEGSWQLWSSDGIAANAHPFTVTQFNRDGLLRLLKLSRLKMPLFATVKGNDFTKEIFPPPMRTIPDAADFVRNIDSKADIRDIFRDYSDENLKLIRNSLDAYDIQVKPVLIKDPVEKRLFETKNKMYRFYMALTNPIQGISLSWYDMREDGCKIHLTKLLIRWSKRKVGVLKYHFNEDSDTFTVMAKRDANQPFSASPETPDYPHFSVPPLDQLYSTEVTQHLDAIENKWEIFGWIMSFSESEIKAIRNLKKEFRLICAVLCTLVKEHLLSELEADGILCSEYKILEDKFIKTPYPDVLVAKCVRAAHKYNIAFSHVRENFAVAGLLTEIQEVLKFDGVYFQTLMLKFEKVNLEQRKRYIDQVKEYVLGSDEIQFDLF